MQLFFMIYKYEFKPLQLSSFLLSTASGIVDPEWFHQETYNSGIENVIVAGAMVYLLKDYLYDFTCICDLNFWQNAFQ